ncbi:MAG: DUF4381 domain-containing protein [Maribacter sp.]|nr:DUF4381 domain-containing protein [Maribacter sp.]
MKYALGTYYFWMLGHFQTSDDQDIVVPDLEPLYEPEPVAFTFDTPAWYVLLVLVLIALVYGLFKWYKSYQSKAYRRSALKKLDGILVSDDPDTAALNTIQITLKQVAMVTYGRPKVAALFGLDWLHFLEKTGKHTQFTPFAMLLGSNSAAANTDHGTQVGALRETAKKWIRTHA